MDISASYVARAGVRCLFLASDLSVRQVRWNDRTGSVEWTDEKSLTGRLQTGRIRVLSVLLDFCAAAANAVSVWQIWRVAKIRQPRPTLRTLFETFIASRILRRSLAQLLREQNVKVVALNQERVPVGAELAVIARRCGSVLANFCNENPIVDIAPLSADLMWVWNELAAKEVREKLEGGSRVVTRIVGNAEAEIVRRGYGGNTNETAAYIARLTHGRPAVVFLSDYDGNARRESDDLEAAAIRLIADAALMNPDITFLVKPRPGHAKRASTIPGRGYLSLPNVVVFEREVSAHILMGADDVRVLCAASSTALYVAHEVGKIAVRLKLSILQAELPIIDAVAIPIGTAVELTDLIAERVAGAERVPLPPARDFGPMELVADDLVRIMRSDGPSHLRAVLT